MKPLYKISLNNGFEGILNKAKIDAEQAATVAAERAKKEVLDRAAKRVAEHKAYLESLKYIDELNFKNNDLRDKIRQSEKKRTDLEKQASIEWRKEEGLHKELQSICSHEMVLERRTTYTDEYDTWHDGNYQRKCIECLLIEEGAYRPTDRSYGYGNQKKFHKLEKSQVIILHQKMDGKVFELEFDDLVLKNI